MATTNNIDGRVDMTFVGLLLIGFVLLILGITGLQEGGLFGDIRGPTKYTDLPIDFDVLAQILLAVGIILLLLTIFEYRVGNKYSAALFVFFGCMFIFYYFSEYSGVTDYLYCNSNWFTFIALAIFSLLGAIYLTFSKAPKFVALLLLLFGLFLVFFSLTCFYSVFGPSDNYDIYKAMGIVYGIFALLGFIVATYLGLAYANPKKIPLI